MVDRGDCTFVTKVRNIERAGGSLAIIIDDINEDISNVIMSDDGTGTGIRIPAMLIGKNDGKILKEFLMSQNADLAGQAALSAEFLVKNPNNKVSWQLWYTSSNDRALDFIKNFQEDVKAFNTEELDFQPRIVTWSCLMCD